MKRLIINSLLQWKQSDHRKPLILKGARQVGKTYILQEFGELAFDQVHYFNFEKSPKLADAFEDDLDPKRIIQALSFILQKKIDVTQDLIIFDEIQACPNALTSLKYFCEDMPNAFVCCAGSLLGVYLGPVSYPVGKVEHLPMHPMSFTEFLMAIGDELSVELFNNITINTRISKIEHDHLWQRLKHYFIVGGLPEVVEIYRTHQDDLFTTFECVRTKQDDLIEDYFSDIAKHSGKVNAMHINRVWRTVPEQLGLSQDGSAKKFKFKTAVPGIDRYSKLAPAIDWLESAGLIFKVYIINCGALPFKAYATENTFKLFMFDVGILGAMSDLSPKTLLDYNYGTYKGYFAENYIAQAFTSAGVKQLFSWTEKTAEVEYLRQIDGEVVPIEVKSGWVTQAKSLRVFAEKYQPPYRVIMSAKPFSIDLENRVRHYPLYLASEFPIE